MNKKLIIAGAVVFCFSVFLSATPANAAFFSGKDLIAPDSPFYFLQGWKESIQTFFTFGAENKAKQYLHLAEVRLAEYQEMLDKGKTDIAQNVLDKYEKQLNNALDTEKKLEDQGKDVKDLAVKVQETVAKHLEVLQNNLQKVPEAAKKGIENAIENANKILGKKENNNNQIANPASVNCEQKGGKLEIRTDSSGGQTGFCIFPDKSECEEWAFMRGECKEGDSNKKVDNGIKKEEALSAMDVFAKCLTDKGVKMYGASWCPHCQNQKALFGESVKYMPYIECAAADGSQTKICQDKGIQAYPTWVFQDNTKLMGELPLEKISQKSGCKLN